VDMTGSKRQDAELARLAEAEAAREPEKGIFEIFDRDEDEALSREPEEPDGN
jgi:hypothetical protein